MIHLLRRVVAEFVVASARPPHYAWIGDRLFMAVAAAPQAGRLLRPLCRALGVSLPPWLALPPAPARRAQARLGRNPPRARREILLPTDHPIPANILQAARAWTEKPC